MRPILFLLVTSSLIAQNGGQFRDWKPDPAEARIRPVKACAEFRSATGYEFSIIAAELVAEAAGVPEYCRVTGLIQPDIRFEVDLPSSWNKRLYMSGNGGFAGDNVETGGALANRMKAIRNGFVATGTNTGHDAMLEQGASFALSRQKLLDFAFRAVHVTVMTAKTLTAAYYGGGPSRSYFDGCSTGGRQGLILAQRFPDDFDGIVVGAPVLNFTGTMINYARMIRALAAGPIPESKMKLLAETLYAECDAKDGLTDGLIDDPRKCNFKPSRDLPKCATGANGESDPSCFTEKQIESLETIYGDMVVQGKRLFPGWPVGAETVIQTGRSGWVPWLIRDEGLTQSANLATSFFRFMAFPERNPPDIAKLDFEKDIPRMEPIHTILDATDTDLTRFQKRGGRIVMYHGWADAALNPLMGLEYYEKVTERFGTATKDFFRLFMVPGMPHCSGGPGVGTFDALTALTQWVEKGTPPERIIGAQNARGMKRTRPLCPHPQVARYKGTGSSEEAANFACAAPK